LHELNLFPLRIYQALTFQGRPEASEMRPMLAETGALVVSAPPTHADLP
jgi:hypothetical protein